MHYRIEASDKLSISGVQPKLSLKLHRGELVLTNIDGEYILKPSPGPSIENFESDVPANEHLSMQLASQVFAINTAINACIRFAGGELAYVTRRFDRHDGQKIPQEDFCQLSNRSPDTAGTDFKYHGSYEELGRLLKQHCPAFTVEIEKLFRLIVFNYVFGNGDAHLKNFSLFKSQFGDYVLTPAYDILCTHLHLPNDARLALDLFDDYETESCRVNGFHTKECFLKLADIYGMNTNRAQKTLNIFLEQRSRVHHLIGQSFLTNPAKEIYSNVYEDRLKALFSQG